MAASSSSVLSTLTDGMKAGKRQMDRPLLLTLYDNLFERAIIRPEPASSSSVQQKNPKCIFVDIDGTLLHGNEAMVNSQLIQQLDAIKHADPSVQIYLFSSMDLRNLPSQGDRVGLFARLHDMKLISGILTTADLKYQDAHHQHKAGSFYEEVYQPLSQLLFDDNHEVKEFTLPDFKAALEAALKTAPGMAVHEAISGMLQKWDESRPVPVLINELVNEASKLSAQEKFKPDANIDDGDKGLLLQLFLKTNPDIAQASLIDDAQNFLASFMKVCEHHQIPFIVHNARNYDNLLGRHNTIEPSQLRNMIHLFLEQEYSAFTALYSAIGKLDKPGYELAVRKLLDLYTLVNPLDGNKQLVALENPCTESALTNLDQIGKNLSVLQYQLRSRTGSHQDIKTNIRRQQDALTSLANQGNPIALYWLAHCLSNPGLPVFATGSLDEIPHDLAAASHFAHAAQACLDKLPSGNLRFEWTVKIDRLIADINHQARKAGLDLDIFSQVQPTTWTVGEMDALSLRHYLHLREQTLTDPQPALAETSMIVGGEQRPCALLDFDGTLKFGQAHELLYNDPMLDVLWEKGIRDVYILSNFHLDYKNVLDREAGIRHLQHRGFTVHGVISPTDLVWARKDLALDYVDAENKAMAAQFAARVNTGASTDMIESEPYRELLDIQDVEPGIAFKMFSQSIRETVARYDAQELIHCTDRELENMNGLAPHPRYYLTPTAFYYQGPDDVQPVSVDLRADTRAILRGQFPTTTPLTPEKRLQIFHMTEHIPESDVLSKISAEGNQLASVEGSIERKLGFDNKGALYHLLLSHLPDWVNAFVYVDDADRMLEGVRNAHDKFPSTKPPLTCIHSRVQHLNMPYNVSVQPFEQFQATEKTRDNQMALSRDYYRTAMVTSDDPGQALTAAKADEKAYLEIYLPLVRHMDALLDDDKRAQYSPDILAYAEAIKREIPLYPERITIEKLRDYHSVFFLAPTIFAAQPGKSDLFEKSLKQVENSRSGVSRLLDRLGGKRAIPDQYILDNVLTANSEQLQRLANLALKGKNLLFPSPSLHTAFECLSLAYMKAKEDTAMEYMDELVELIEEHTFDAIAASRKNNLAPISRAISTWRRNIEATLILGCPERHPGIQQYADRSIQIYGLAIGFCKEDEVYKERLSDTLHSFKAFQTDAAPAPSSHATSSSTPG